MKTTKHYRTKKAKKKMLKIFLPIKWTKNKESKGNLADEPFETKNKRQF